MKKGYPWPADPGYPAVAAAPIWRNRHLRMGEGLARTAPPSKVQGPPSSDTVAPYLEGPPGAALGGAYDQHARSIGLDEPPTAAVLNRPIYDLGCAADQIAEQCLAVPKVDSVTLGSTSDEVAFTGGLLYLGPPGTDGGDPDHTKRPSAYIELRESNGLDIVTAPATGDPVIVHDVRSTTNEVSFYAQLPSYADGFPTGMYGVIYAISTTVIANDTIQFLAGFPSGVPAPPTTDPVGLFNYSRFERLLRDGLSPVDAFASTEEIVTIPPDLVQTNRNLTTAGWLPGDIVYSSRFVYSPQILLSEPIASGSKRLFYSTAWYGLSIFEGFASYLGLNRSDDHSPAFTISEPATATLYGFDYANALFRAMDSNLRGTIGFDFRGESAHQNPGTVASAADAYSGFLHRKLMAFDDGLNTVVSVDEPVSWSGSAVTITNYPAHHFYGVSAANKNIILGVDLIELTDSTGKKVGLFFLNSVGTADVCGILDITGGAVALPADTGTMRIYRPQFRTGMWDPTSLPAFASGNLFLGDDYAGVATPAVAAMSLGLDSTDLGNDLYQGFSSAIPRYPSSAITEQPKLRFRVSGDGGIEFSGHSSGYRGRLSSYLLTSPWYGTGESWSSAIFPIDDAVTKPWHEKGVFAHSLYGNDGVDSVYLQCCTAGIGSPPPYGPNPVSSLASGEHAGVFFGLPARIITSGFVAGAVVAAGNRDAGFLFAHNDGGDMLLSLGFTTAGGLLRDLVLKEVPSFAPPSPFSSRLEANENISYGWRTGVSLYKNISMADGYPSSGSAWALKILTGKTYRVSWELPLGSTDNLVHFPLHLPQGAILGQAGDKIEAVFSNVDAANSATVSVTLSYDEYGGGTEASQTGSALVIPALTIDTAELSATPDVTVDHSTRQYTITLKGTSGAAGVLWLLGLRVKYRIVDLLP